MKISISKRKEWWLVVLVICSWLFIPKVANFAFMIVLYLYVIYKRNGKFSINMPGRFFYFYFLLVGIAVGIMNMVLTDYSVYNFIKHIYYFLGAYLFWALGEGIGRISKSRLTILSALFSVSVLYVFYDVVRSGILLLSGNYQTLRQFRALVGNGTFLPVIGLYMLFFYRDKLEISRKKNIVYSFLLIISLLIHFSRTHVIELMILFLFSGVTSHLKKAWKIAFICVCGIAVVASLFPEMFSSFVQKMIHTTTEINFRDSNWDFVAINNNWRGFEAYCEMQKFQNSGLAEQLFGGGFGTTLDAMGYAHLVSEEDTLIFLHNGYFTQLMIWGIAGVLFFVGWLISLFRYALKVKTKQDRNLLRGFVVIIACTTYFVMGPFFSSGIAIFLFLIALFGELEKSLIHED